MYPHTSFTLPQLIECGFLSIIKQRQLITQDNINLQYDSGRTALHIAVISNQVEIVEYLLGVKGVDVDVEVRDGVGLNVREWLGVKVEGGKGQVERMTEIIQGKAMLMEEKMEEEMIEKEKHEKAKVKVDHEKVDIFRAAQLGLYYLQPFFSRQKQQPHPNNSNKNRNPYTKDHLNRKAIHYAAISGNLSTFTFLKQHKFDPLQEDIFGFNCYHYISANPHNPLNQAVLAKGMKNQPHHEHPNNHHSRNLTFTQKQNHYDVIVIGSGAAGIAAGVNLSRNGIDFLVLQARDRLGGRIVSQQVDGVEMDLGACWVHSYSKNNPICKEVAALGWKAKKGGSRTDAVIVCENMPDTSQQDTHQALLTSRAYFATVQHNSLTSPHEISIHEAGHIYYQKFITTLPPHKKALVDMFINMTEHYNAATIKQLSGKYFQEQEDVGGDFMPQGSYARLLGAIAASVKLQERVRFGQVVKEICYGHTQKENKEDKEEKDEKQMAKEQVTQPLQSQYPCTITTGTTTYHCRTIISSLPLGILKSNTIEFHPQLPPSHRQCITHLGYGTMNKLIVSFQQPFWQQNPSWLRIACEQKGKFPAIYNFSTQTKHVLCCFLTDDFALSLSHQTDQQILESFIDLVKKTFAQETIIVRDYKVTRWDTDPFSLGSYTHFAVGSNMETTRRLRKHIAERLWMVGEHCYGEHIGCAHGAYQTGVWAADEIVRLFKGG